MDEKILDDEEAELFGLKRKILPEEEPEEKTGGQDPAVGEAEAIAVGVASDGDGAFADPEEEELPLDALRARLDEGYTLDGYIDENAVPLDFSDAEEDDESLVMLSPEEAAEAVRRREEKAKRDKARFDALVQAGQAALDAGDFEKARECFTQANEFNSDDLEMNVGYMRAYSEDFTLSDESDMLADVYEQCRNSAGEAFVRRIREMFGKRIAAEAAAAEQRAGQLLAAHTAETEERGKELSARMSAATGLVIKLGLPFAVCLVAVMLFGGFVNAIEGNLFLILLIVFGVAGIGLFVPLLFAVRKAVEAAAYLRDNERLDSTEAGQKSLEAERYAAYLRACLADDGAGSAAEKERETASAEENGD